jgi:N-acetylneuraminic acid mutarotase
MWMFGGEFTSPYQQFRHYNDFWVLHLSSMKWEQIKAKGGPTARSGHRMCAFKKKIIVFGGFHDNLDNVKYLDDMYVFDLE